MKYSLVFAAGLVVFITVQASAVSVGNNNSNNSPKQTTLLPSHDTFIRKDGITRSHGKGSKITITKHGANQRIGLMQFDTSSYDLDSIHQSIDYSSTSSRSSTTSEDVVSDEGDQVQRAKKAYLRLGVAETTKKEEEVQIKIFRLDNGFHEDYVSWKNFDGKVDGSDFVEFTVQKDHENKVGQVEVTKLIQPGSDTVLAFIIEGKGHVKFHSKDVEESKLAPSLIFEEL